MPPQYKADAQRKASKSISFHGKNLSSVFVPDIESGLAYGDFKGTTDALLFVFHNLQVVNGVIQKGGVIEVFIARGKNKDSIPLYNLLSDGELDEEMDYLRQKATPF